MNKHNINFSEYFEKRFEGDYSHPDNKETRALKKLFSQKRLLKSFECYLRGLCLPGWLYSERLFFFKKALPWFECPPKNLPIFL